MFRTVTTAFAALLVVATPALAKTYHSVRGRDVVGCVEPGAVDQANRLPGGDPTAGAAWNDVMDAGECFPTFPDVSWTLIGRSGDLLRLQTGIPPTALYFRRQDMRPGG